MKKLLNNEFENLDFILEDNAVYFDSKNIALMSGVSERTVRRNCNALVEEYLPYPDLWTNLSKSLYFEKTGKGRPRRFYSHLVVFDFLHRANSPNAMKFRVWANNKTLRKSEQTKSLEQDAHETIQHLKEKAREEEQLALDSKTKKEFNIHMDLSDKYLMDAKKREEQLKNENNCRNRLRDELELNKRGILTESTDKPVFLPKDQTTLFDYREKRLL